MNQPMLTPLEKWAPTQNLGLFSDKENISETWIDIRARVSWLLELWLSQKAIKRIEHDLPTLRDPQKVRSKIEAYRALGFKGPEKMIENFPSMLHYNIEGNIRPKIEMYRATGFKNPEKMIESSPSMLGYDIEGNLKPKIEAYRALGFKNPEKMLEVAPSMLGYDIEGNIRPKIEAYRAMGLKNPEKIIEGFPSMLNYSIEGNIRPKIEAYRAMGFKNPEKMIESFPSMFGYAITGNIKPKLQYIKKIIRCFDIPIDIISLLEDVPVFFGYKKEKIQLCARILSQSLPPDTIRSSHLSRVLRTNIEYLLLASAQTPNGRSLSDLLCKSEEIKKLNLSPEQKIARILAECDPKIVRIYRRGYLEKKKKK